MLLLPCLLHFSISTSPSAAMVSPFPFLCLAVMVFLHSSAQELGPGERELRRNLFRDYDKTARPVQKQSTAVPVKISMTPLSLKHLSEKTQLISLESWVMLTWMDESLKWNPADYDNITELHVPPTQVWRPDIAVYTASPDTSLFPTMYTEVLLYNSGTLLWVPPFTINSRCPMPFRNYATSARTFIECNIRMGSWTYSGKMLDLQLATDKVDLTNFQDYNFEWKLVKVVSNRESKLYPCCPDEYPLVNFNVTLKRRNYYFNHGNEN